MSIKQPNSKAVATFEGVNFKLTSNLKEGTSNQKRQTKRGKRFKFFEVSLFPNCKEGVL